MLSTPNSPWENVLWSGISPVPGLSSSKTLFPPAWISSMARVWVIPWVGSPLISTIWSPTWGKKSSRLVFGNLWHCELVFNLERKNNRGRCFCFPSHAKIHWALVTPFHAWQAGCDPRVWGFRGAQRLSAQEKIPEIKTTSSIYLQVMKQIQDVLECIFIIVHGVEGAHGSTTLHLSEVTLSRGGHNNFPTPTAELNTAQTGLM